MGQKLIITEEEKNRIKLLWVERQHVRFIINTFKRLRR